jgi:hypothetical protein
MAMALPLLPSQSAVQVGVWENEKEAVLSSRAVLVVVESMKRMITNDDDSLV